MEKIADEKTRHTVDCRQSRRMGDPQVFLDPTTYSVQCDQLDSGCDDAGRCDVCVFTSRTDAHTLCFHPASAEDATPHAANAKQL